MSTNQALKRKKKLIVVVGYSLFILVWLIVIGLSLELFERWRWRHIETTNKFVRIRKGELLFSEWSEGQVEGIQYGEGKSLLAPQMLLVGDDWCEPEPDPLEIWGWRFNKYLENDDTFKKCFKSIYRVVEKIVNFSKAKNEVVEVVDVNPDIKDELSSYDLTNIIYQVPKNNFYLGRTFLSEHIIGDKTLLFYFSPYTNSEDISSFHCFIVPINKVKNYDNPLMTNVSVNELWDIPYFSYMPHINSSVSQFRTNNFGFRDHDFVCPKPPGKFRILCIGASTTEEGMSNRETYPKFLEKELQNHFGQGRIEVFNCGVSGMTSKKHIARLPDYLYFQPDLVIFYEGINDIVYEVFPYAFTHSPQILRRLFISSHFARREARYLLPYSQKELRESLNLVIFTALDYLNDTFLQQGIDLCISSIGVPYRDKLTKEERDYYDYYYDKEWGWANSTFQQYCDIMKMYNQRLREYCKENSLLYIPVEEHIPAGTKYFGDVCHLRREGIELKARVMAESLIPYLEQILDKPEEKAISTP